MSNLALKALLAHFDQDEAELTRIADESFVDEALSKLADRIVPALAKSAEGALPIAEKAAEAELATGAALTGAAVGGLFPPAGPVAAGAVEFLGELLIHKLYAKVQEKLDAAKARAGA